MKLDTISEAGFMHHSTPRTGSNVNNDYALLDKVKRMLDFTTFESFIKDFPISTFLKVFLETFMQIGSIYDCQVNTQKNSNVNQHFYQLHKKRHNRNRLFTIWLTQKTSPNV